VHFSPVLLYMGLDPTKGDVPEAPTQPNGKDKVSHASVPMGSTSMGL